MCGIRPQLATSSRCRSATQLLNFNPITHVVPTQEADLALVNAVWLGIGLETLTLTGYEP